MTPYGIRQVCGRPSHAGVVSVLNCCLFISRLRSSAVMVGEGKCEPTREKALHRQPKQSAIDIINLSESQAPNSSEFAASLKHLSSRRRCIESAERTSLHFKDALRRRGTLACKQELRRFVIPQHLAKQSLHDGGLTLLEAQLCGWGISSHFVPETLGASLPTCLWQVWIIHLGSQIVKMSQTSHLSLPVRFSRANASIRHRGPQQHL